MGTEQTQLDSEQCILRKNSNPSSIESNGIAFNWPWILVASVFAICIIAYTINFNSHDVSSDPGDWGALGDYLGGITNPIISTIALIFLAKAYHTQKEELKETRQALRDTAEHSAASASAQKDLVDCNIAQSLMTQKNLEVSILAAEVSSRQNTMAFLHRELDRSTETYNAHRQAIDIFKVQSLSWFYDNDKADDYRLSLVRKMNAEQDHINDLLEKISKINEV